MWNLSNKAYEPSAEEKETVQKIAGLLHGFTFRQASLILSLANEALSDSRVDSLTDDRQAAE